MGKSIPSATGLQEVAKIVTSDRIRQHWEPVKSLRNKTRIVPPPEPAKSKAIRVQSDKQQQTLNRMEESSSLDRRTPLAEVVLECSRRWFQETLKEAKAGDTSMQVLVGQMYCSGYGVAKDEQKGRSWIERASRNRSSVWTVGDKRPGYNASDSDSDEEKAGEKRN